MFIRFSGADHDRAEEDLSEVFCGIAHYRIHGDRPQRSSSGFVSQMRCGQGQGDLQRQFRVSVETKSKFGQVDKSQSRTCFGHPAEGPTEEKVWADAGGFRPAIRRSGASMCALWSDGPRSKPEEGSSGSHDRQLADRPLSPDRSGPRFDLSSVQHTVGWLRDPAGAGRRTGFVTVSAKTAVSATQRMIAP